MKGTANCKICGKLFRKKVGNQICCSKECSVISNRNRMRIYLQNHPERHEPVQPREIICNRCGKPFLGKSNQKICMDCLLTRPDCKRYISWRSDSMRVGGSEWTDY